MSSQKYAAVIVFGDIGRSPRMSNHAVEITKNLNHNVYLIGYNDSQPQTDITENKKIQIVDINSSLVMKLKKLPPILYLVYAFLRIII